MDQRQSEIMNDTIQPTTVSSNKADMLCTAQPTSFTTWRVYLFPAGIFRMLHTFISYKSRAVGKRAFGSFQFLFLSPAWLISYLDVPACLKCGEHEHEAEAEDDDVEQRLSFGTHLDRMVLAVVPRLTGHLAQSTRQTCPSHDDSIKHCEPRLLKPNRGHMRCTW